MDLYQTGMADKKSVMWMVENFWIVIKYGCGMFKSGSEKT